MRDKSSLHSSLKLVLEDRVGGDVGELGDVFPQLTVVGATHIGLALRPLDIVQLDFQLDVGVGVRTALEVELLPEVLTIREEVIADIESDFPGNFGLFFVMKNGQDDFRLVELGLRRVFLIERKQLVYFDALRVVALIESLRLFLHWLIESFPIGLPEQDEVVGGLGGDLELKDFEGDFFKFVHIIV